MQIFDYAKCITRLFRASQSTLQYTTCYRLAEQSCSKATQRVAKEIPPIGRTSRCECLLANLDKSAKDNRSNDGPRDKALGLSMHVTFEILKPQHHAETEVHSEMQHLVNISNLVKGCLRRIKERKEQNNAYDKNGQRVFLQVAH